MAELQISEAFAKELLRALYKMDAPIGQLDTILTNIPPGKDRDNFKIALGTLMGIVLSELMAPIYKAQPQLGTASQPGQWFNG